MPSNFSKWQTYTANLPSPQSFVDFGFYFLISSCLQRRVWIGNLDHKPLFPNLFLILVAGPAVGKSLVLDTVADMLAYHKDKTQPLVKTNSPHPEFQPLFPTGPDCITFEKLLAKIASSGRLYTTKDVSYFHTSFGFTLSELSSLFREKQKDVVKLLIKAYDCDKYDNETKHQGNDRIRRICLNFAAATQLEFLKEAHKYGIFGQGFSSRVIFLFETARRFDAYHIADTLSLEQLDARRDILTHLLNLSTLYGPVSYSGETRKFLEDWYINVHCPRELHAGERMKDYLGRKKVMLPKLAMAMHFSDSDNINSYVIKTETFEAALNLLDSVEPNMEAGLAISGRNELHVAARKMRDFIKSKRECPESDIILEFAADLNVDQILLCIKELEMSYNLKSRVKENGRRWFYL